jgi:hypothetical protein
VPHSAQARQGSGTRTRRFFVLGLGEWLWLTSGPTFAARGEIAAPGSAGKVQTGSGRRSLGWVTPASSADHLEKTAGEMGEAWSIVQLDGATRARVAASRARSSSCQGQ